MRLLERLAGVVVAATFAVVGVLVPPVVSGDRSVSFDLWIDLG
jgi:hypothetical protein